MATRIFIGSLGDVAPITVFAETELETAVGGEASVGFITIRDVGLTRADFIPMSRITVDRGPGTDPIYSGYLIKPSRRFWFDVDYPETLQRKWVLHVADINLLWARRVIYNQSDPANITGPKYTTDTYDDDALAELFADWVDLSFDDLDTSSQVQRVGKINYDQTTYPWNGGQMMGEAVRTIAQLPAAVYGINSKREVVYADVDDENAPFVLSDAYIPPRVFTPALHASKYNAGILDNPALGRTSVALTGLDMSIDPTDPNELMDWSANGDRGPIWWLKMQLDNTARLRLDTAGSTLVDTQLFVYKKGSAPMTLDEAIWVADDPTRGYTIECQYDGVVAIWPFDETAGTVATDWSEAGGKSGFYRGSPTLNQSAVGTLKSVLFNGVNQWADAPNFSGYNFSTGPMSFEVWAKRVGGLGSANAFFGKGGGAPFVFVDSTGRIVLARADTADIVKTTNPVFATAGVWHHIVVTYLPNVAAGIYVDGAPVTLDAINHQTFTTNSNRQAIASKSAGGENLWPGALSAPAIYNKILTQDEVSRHYRQAFQNHAASPGLPNGSLTYDTYDAGTYYIGIQSVYNFLDPWENKIQLNVTRHPSDTVIQDLGWTPEGTPGAEEVGYRECTIIHDGTRLANDVMAWGFGMGAPLGVFKRLRDGESVLDHGLWQEAVTLYSVYKQATINKVADSIVNGSPGSRRGRKNDKDSVECVIHRDGLHVGDRVRFISHIWRYEDVIPVRKMKLKFPTPDDVRYELVLSHEIDEWGFQDPLPPFSVPGPYPVPVPDVPIIVEPPPKLPPSCVESEQMVDNLGRNVGPTSGPWTNGSTDMWGQISANFVNFVSRFWLNWGLTSTFGDANDQARVLAASGEAYLKVASKEFGVRQAYYAAAPWNRDVVTVTIGFGFYAPFGGGSISSIPAGTEVELTLGAMKVVFRPTDNEIDLVTASGTTTASFNDWEHETWYLAELSLDLVNNSVRVKLERETDPNEFFELSRAANSERAGVGDYNPELGIWVRSLSATSTVWFGRMVANTYADAAEAEIDFLQGFAVPPWSGEIPGVNLGSDGVISVNDTSLLNSSNFITRQVPQGIGSMDIAFSVSDYIGSFDLFQLFFDASRFNYLWVSIGELSARVGDSSGSGGAGAGFSTSLFNGNPVNIRCQWSSTFVRIKAWAGGTSEPEAWGATNYYTMQTGPDIILGFRPFLFFEADTFTIGPLQLDTGEAPARIVYGPTDITQRLSDLQNGFPTTNSHGRVKVFGFTNPGGTSASFPPSSYTKASVSLPNGSGGGRTYSVGMAWPIFNPIVGHGVPNEIIHRIGSMTFPIVLHDGEPIEYAVRVKGTISARIGEAARTDLGATGILAPINVILEVFDYGTGAAVDPPPFVDYNIDQGFDVWNSVYENVAVGSPETKSFDIVVNDHLQRQPDGSAILQMSAYAVGISDTLIQQIEDAGPLWGGAFLVTGNNGSLGINIGTATFEMVPTGLGYPMNPRLDPCPPNPVGYDYSQQNGRICTTWYGEEIDGVVDDFPMPGKYLTGSVDVIVNGETLTPGEDFTETVDNTEVHLITPPPAGAWVFICCTVI